MPRILPLIMITALAFPLAIAAQENRAGTADFLRSIGFTDAHFANEQNTEDREPFLLARGEGVVKDPVGDVLNRVGGLTELEAGWGDIAEASLARNTQEQSWDLRIAFAEPLPSSTSLRVNIIGYIDADRDPENNEDEGIGIGTDAEYKLLVSREEGGWTSAYRYYNPAFNARTWGRDKESAMTFDVGEREVLMRIPFAEIPEDAEPRWRAVAALAGSFKNADTQVDAAPQVGFPPPTGETYPGPRTLRPPENGRGAYAVAVIAAAALGAAVVWRMRKG